MTNKYFLAILTALFLMSRPLWAQGGNYVIEQRYVHELVWIGDEYALKYEVVIERNEGGAYRAYMREFTESPKLQISVPPGNYRYRVIPYDYLEQSGEASKWINIDIKPVPIVPVEVLTTEDGGYVLHSSDNKPLIPGVNELVIKKPDELETQNGVFVVDKQAAVTSESEKPINFYFSAAWAPLFPIYGGLEQIFGNEFYGGGAALRFGAFYNKIKWFNPGLELSTSWYVIKKIQDNDDIVIQAGVTCFNFVLQKWTDNRKMAFTLRLGGGLAFHVGRISNSDRYSPMGSLVPQINLEASFIWLAMKQLYLETGLGCILFLSDTDFSSCLRPWLGLGWKF